MRRHGFLVGRAGSRRAVPLRLGLGFGILAARTAARDAARPAVVVASAEMTGLRPSAARDGRLGAMRKVEIRPRVSEVPFAGLFPVGRHASPTIPIPSLPTVSSEIAGALAALLLAGPAFAVDGRIGLFILAAPVAGNTVSPVAWARARREAGASLAQAAIDAVRSRYRAVGITGPSVRAGLLPRVFASGAAAITRRSVATAVSGGTPAATRVRILEIPSPSAVFQSAREGRAPRLGARRRSAERAGEGA